jgi:hypothetical protein
LKTNVSKLHYICFRIQIRIEAGLHLTSTRGPLPFHPNIQPTLAYFFDRLQAPPPPVPASVEFSDLASTPSVKSALRSIAPTPVPGTASS